MKAAFEKTNVDYEKIDELYQYVSKLSPRTAHKTKQLLKQIQDIFRDEAEFEYYKKVLVNADKIS